MGRPYEKNIDDEIIKHYADGLVGHQIAKKVFKSTDTIRARVDRLKQKHDCKTITQLVVKLIQKK